MLLQIRLAKGKQEVMAINVHHVLSVIPKGDSQTYIIDSNGMDYLVDESYDSLFIRFNNIKNI